MKKLFVLLTLSFIVSGSFAQANRNNKSAYAWNINSIVSAEINNLWTNKKWSLSADGIKKLKAIFNNVIRIDHALLVKPGHLYLTLKFKYKPSIRFYMYPDVICKDDTQPISFTLNEKINWDKLK